jgi:RimJ/RimL family protein N-acetyltransferase
MHMAGSNGFFTRAFLRAIFKYPFEQLECNVVIAQISSANEQSLSVAKRIGFKQVCRIPDALVDGDAIILTLYRDDCIWLEKRHELRKETAEAA